MNVEAVELLVTPEQLTIASNDMSNSLNQMYNCIQDLDQIIKTSETYWRGDAGDYFRNLFLNERPAIDAAIRKLSEHPKDLIEIAGHYIDTEHILESLAEELPSDVIT